MKLWYFDTAPDEAKLPVMTRLDMVINKLVEHGMMPNALQQAAYRTQAARIELTDADYTQFLRYGEADSPYAERITTQGARTYYRGLEIAAEA